MAGRSTLNPNPVNLEPLHPGALGSYILSTQTGTMAAGLAADSEVLQFRWTDTAKLAVVHRVAFEGLGSITAFTAGFALVRATIARSFTVAGTGGGAATITTNNGKVRTSYATTLLGEVRTATTAALGAGTKTLDAQDIGSVLSGVGASPAVSVPRTDLFTSLGGAQHPIVLAANEGIVVRATVPATGTWTGGFTIAWTEVAQY